MKQLQKRTYFVENDGYILCLNDAMATKKYRGSSLRKNCKGIAFYSSIASAANH